MNAVNQITESLNKVFAAMDAEVLQASKEWAKGRKAALVAFDKSDEYQAIRRNSDMLYARRFAIAGGKTWYNVFTGRNDAMIEEIMVKNCKAIAEKRNASIATKLVKNNVSEVVSEEYTYTKDGFNGSFIVNTNVGKKIVKIETIRAGGYNIQCLHLRVLVSVK